MLLFVLFREHDANVFFGNYVKCYCCVLERTSEWFFGPSLLFTGNSKNTTVSLAREVSSPCLDLLHAKQRHV